MFSKANRNQQAPEVLELALREDWGAGVYVGRVIRKRAEHRLRGGDRVLYIKN